MISPSKAGLVIGALIGAWHFVWSLLVAIGWAQPLLDFIFWAHMIRRIYIVSGFNPIAAIVLITVTSVIGYAFGYIGAIIWNKLARS